MSRELEAQLPNHALKPRSQDLSQGYPAPYSFTKIPLIPIQWFADTVPNFRVLPKSSIPPTVDSGTAFKSVCINTAIYLPYLASECLKNGVTIKRAVLDHINEAAALHASGMADVVVNCTGLLASKLGGVMDKEVYPARGQIVLVRNTPGAMFTISGTDDGDDEVSYSKILESPVFQILTISTRSQPLHSIY